MNCHGEPVTTDVAVPTKPNDFSLKAPIPDFWEYSANLSILQHKACVRGHQWLADRVAAGNRSDAFHNDRNYLDSETNVFLRKYSRNAFISETILIQKRFRKDSEMIKKIFRYKFIQLEDTRYKIQDTR